MIDPAPIWHSLNEDDLSAHLATEVRSGLSSAEVEERRQRWGFNEVTRQRGTPGWVKFLRQFLQPLAYLLVIAAGVTAVLGEWVDSTVIAAVVVINAIVGYLQEAKAEKAIAALARMIPAGTTVRRDGRRQRVATRELVPGDLIVLEAGDHVPADARVLRARALQADESALTGESLAEKGGSSRGGSHGRPRAAGPRHGAEIPRRRDPSGGFS